MIGGRDGKKQQAIVIESQEDADRALQRIGRLERHIADAEKDACDEIDEIRARLLDDTAVRRKRRSKPKLFVGPDVSEGDDMMPEGFGLFVTKGTGFLLGVFDDSLARLDFDLESLAAALALQRPSSSIHAGTVDRNLI